MVGFSAAAINFKEQLSAYELFRSIYLLRPVEFSALRESEFDLILDLFLSLNPTNASFHAPSKYENEKHIVNRLKSVRSLNSPIILHPDAIIDYTLWQDFDNLLLENMDFRKAPRSVDEMSKYFELLPKSNWCFDVAHSKGISDELGFDLLKNFKDKLKKIHISKLRPCSAVHECLDEDTLAYYKTLNLPQTTVIIESPVDFNKNAVIKELEYVNQIYPNCS